MRDGVFKKIADRDPLLQVHLLRVGAHLMRDDNGHGTTRKDTEK